MAPTDLSVVEELIGFFTRQGDQRSFLLYLDRSVATMRNRLNRDALDAFAHVALFKMFGWRKSTDPRLCAAQVLSALGEGGDDPDVAACLAQAAGHAGHDLGDAQYDDLLFHRAIPGGFRQVFALLGEPFARIHRGDLRAHGVKRGDRLTDGGHPVRRLADQVARELGVTQSYELYVVGHRPEMMLVENTDPPAILLGSSLVQGSTEAQLRFLLARCLWLVRRSMILPARLSPEDLEVLVTAIVGQYAPEFQPPSIDAGKLADISRQVGRAIPRKIHSELMPFALECSGPSVELRALAPAVVDTANRVGLLACGSVGDALVGLGRAAGARGTGEELARALRGNRQAEALIRFAVSDLHFELRRVMGASIG